MVINKGGYYGETDGTSNPWSFPIAFKNKPFYVNGSADLSSKSAYDFDRPAWAMAINNTQFLCSINYDKTGTTGYRQYTQHRGVHEPLLISQLISFLPPRKDKSMNYVFVLNEHGVRQTSYVVGVHADTLEETEQLAKQTYPSANIVTGDSEMQAQFTNGKAYVNGAFTDIPVTQYEPTKVEQIADIKKYYNSRFETLEQMVLRRRLINGDISDLQEQYKKLNMEMLAKIKAVK